MSDYIECPGCRKQLKKTTSGKYRKHKPFQGATADNFDCDFSGTVIPPEEECQPPLSSPAPSPTASSATSPPGGATDHAGPATSGTASSPPSPAEVDDASTTAPADGVLPGVTEYTEALNATAETQRAEFKARVDAALTPFSQPAPVEEAAQPTLFSQPAGRHSELPVADMTDLGKELAARLKELFYAYDNRRSADNRSAQTTMGPSEMGTPCDRRLALSLMRMPPVNPGGDGWAAFVGTAIHASLADMFLWANHGTGRFAIETRLEFDSRFVPKGTADLIDRTLFMLDDHKCQGRWSRNKLKSQGPSPTYRVQAHVYAHGARRRGEKIEHIAIISWPRDEATLDDLYVHTEPYNPAIAAKAFERVERIGQEVEEYTGDAVPLEERATVAARYDVADDCRFCPFFLPNARDITRGCNGRQ